MCRENTASLKYPPKSRKVFAVSASVTRDGRLKLKIKEKRPQQSDTNLVAFFGIAKFDGNAAEFKNSGQSCFSQRE